MGDAVVDQNGVEGAAEVEGPHVALDEFAFGVEIAGQLQHGGAEVEADAAEGALEGEEVFAAAAGDVEESFDGPSRALADACGDVAGEARVFAGRIAPQRPQPGQVGIEAGWICGVHWRNLRWLFRSLAHPGAGVRRQIAPKDPLAGLRREQRRREAWGAMACGGVFPLLNRRECL